MFVSFTIKNAYSFLNEQILNARAVATCKERREEATFTPFSDKGKRLVKTLAIYGANASGKSNIFYAMSEMRENVLCSVSEVASDVHLRGMPFIFSEEGRSCPSFYALEFVVGEYQYKYGYSIKDGLIVNEFLLRKGVTGNLYRELFSRGVSDKGDFVHCHPSFGADELVISKKRMNALFLSTCAMLSVSEAVKVVDYFAKKLKIVSGDRLGSSYTARELAVGHNRDKIIQFLRMTDFGIGSVDVTEAERETGRLLPDGTKEFVTVYEPQIHPILKDGGISKMALPLRSIASLGTIKAFSLAAYIFEALETGSVLVLDELDSRLHPLLTKEIIRLFNQSKTNPKKAQLIFNTHDTNLLGVRVFNSALQKKECLLRRDEIYFVEKNGEMCSKVYSLSDFKKEGCMARNRIPYESDYLDGLYGAIPYLGWK